MKIEAAVSDILSTLGYDLDDPNFTETPKRVAAWLKGFHCKPEGDLGKMLKTFPSDHKELVIVKDITFTALCAHHMLPFIGKAHVGYIPQGNVVGISKLSRVMTYWANRMTIQEDITNSVANTLMDHLKPMGVMVVLEAEHQCMTIRGVKDPCARTVTSAVRGVFLGNEKGSKDEFLQLIAR